MLSVCDGRCVHPLQGAAGREQIPADGRTFRCKDFGPHAGGIPCQGRKVSYENSKVDNALSCPAARMYFVCLHMAVPIAWSFSIETHSFIRIYRSMDCFLSPPHMRTIYDLTSFTAYGPRPWSEQAALNKGSSRVPPNTACKEPWSPASALRT